MEDVGQPGPEEGGYDAHGWDAGGVVVQLGD